MALVVREFVCIVIYYGFVFVVWSIVCLLVLIVFVVVSVLSTGLQTPVIKPNTSLIHAAKICDIRFLIYLSLADKLGGASCVR